MRIWVVLLTLFVPHIAWAQCDETRPLAIEVQGMSFAHNTEFLANPYREGETLLGSHAQTFGVLPLGCAVQIRVGVFVDTRAGDEKSFRQVRPIISLVINTGNSTFALGTLISRSRIATAGPEQEGLHGLLPPIQNEEFAIERGHENGLQWLYASQRVESEIWVNWQLLNTPEHREKFDAGVVGRTRIVGPLSVGWQWHVVHHGGQLYSAGQPVADSIASAGGLILERKKPRLFLVAGPRVLDDITNELWIIGSKHVPDRSIPELNLNGHGFFYRSTLRKNGWRINFIRWWGRDFIKAEGDANYGFLNSDGSYSPLLGQTRAYVEYGAAHQWQLSPTTSFEAVLKLHKIGESGVDYSYEMKGIWNFTFPFQK